MENLRGADEPADCAPCGRGVDVEAGGGAAFAFDMRGEGWETWGLNMVKETTTKSLAGTGGTGGGASARAMGAAR